MKTKVPDCVHPDHVDGESCLDKSAVCCSKDCPCCHGSTLRYINNTNFKPAYVDLSYDPNYIDKGLEQNLIASIEVIEDGYWVEIPIKGWESTKAKLLSGIKIKGTLYWDNKNGGYIESPRIDAFLNEIAEVCQRHGLSISHEDQHGGFLITEFGEANIEWLKSACDATGTKKG